VVASEYALHLSQYLFWITVPDHGRKGEAGGGRERPFGAQNLPVLSGV